MNDQLIENDLPGPNVYTIITESGDAIEGHRTDDPNVWGLGDVARGRTPLVPTTVYKTSGDSASGVAGLLFPSGEFVGQLGTRIGQSVRIGLLHDVLPAPHEPTIEYETAWDGAKPATPFVNEETGEPGQEHSRGLLLGDYQVRSTVPQSTFAAERKRGKLSHARGGPLGGLRMAA